MPKYSVNKCGNSSCNKQLTLTEVSLHMYECTECTYHSVTGTRSIEAYNEWLKR